MQQLINDTARKNDKSTMSSVSILHHKYRDRRKEWWRRRRRWVQWGLCPRALERMQLESLPELSFFSLDALKHSVTPGRSGGWERKGQQGKGDLVCKILFTF